MLFLSIQQRSRNWEILSPRTAQGVEIVLPSQLWCVPGKPSRAATGHSKRQAVTVVST